MGFLEEHRTEIFKKYSDEELLKDIYNFRCKNGKLTKTLNHFFEELIFESCGRSSTISPMDVLKDDEKLKEIFAYIETKPKFYTGNDVTNLKSYMRNAVSWVRKVANFSPKTAREIFNRYNIDGESLQILDTSAGFGARLSGAVLSGHEYVGIDPNKKLVGKLNEYIDFLEKYGLIGHGQAEIIEGGSETFYPELEGRFDLMFTSPPYFNLERYSDDGCASTENYDNYPAWLSNFIHPTVFNVYKYLKVGGYAMMNIKNLPKYPLYDDVKEAFGFVDGFVFVESFDMKLPSAKNYGMAGNCTIPKAEPVMVFKKIR